MRARPPAANAARAGPALTFDVVKRLGGFELRCSAEFGGGITAVFGPSGSGKTTLLNCVAGLTKPDDGEIAILGATVYSASRRVNLPPERRRIGYVFQDSALFPHMSVMDNIRYGHRLTPESERALSVEDAVEMLHLTGLLDRGTEGLSGGERQRVALARALAASPRLLLLDEPLSSLDLAFRGMVLRHLRQAHSELGVPMVYVSHSMSEVMAIADDALALSDGASVIQGPPRAALVDPRMSGLADYATLENLLDAEVARKLPDGGQAELRVGSARLFALNVEAEPGERVTIAIRSSDILVALDVPTRISAQNVLTGTVEDVHVQGRRVILYVDAGARMIAEITPDALRALGLSAGDQVHLVIKSASIMALDPGAR